MILIANNITKSYKTSKNKNPFRLEINRFELEEGEIFTLLGQNGSGKTTLIKALLNLLFIDTGSILIFGLPHHNKLSRENVGYLPEDFLFSLDYKFIDAISLYNLLRKTDIAVLEKDLDELMEELLLNNLLDKKISTLSKGMMQTLGLVNSIINKNKLLILDEPFNGLDPEQKNRTMRYLLKLNKEHKVTIFLTTHNLIDAEQMSNRVAIIKNGKILNTESMEKIKNSFNNLESFYFSYQ